MFLILFTLLVGVQTGAATVESSMELPQKFIIKFIYDPVIPLLRIYLKKPKTLIQNNINTPTLIAALFTIAKI